MSENPITEAELAEWEQLHREVSVLERPTSRTQAYADTCVQHFPRLVAEVRRLQELTRPNGLPDAVKNQADELDFLLCDLWVQFSSTADNTNMAMGLSALEELAAALGIDPYPKPPAMTKEYPKAPVADVVLAAYTAGQKSRQTYPGDLRAKLLRLLDYGFDCEAGPLENCADFQALLALAPQTDEFEAPPA